MKVILIGNPNVGKSVLFSRLTGLNIISSNYPGTTIEYTQGVMKLDKDKIEIIDVPGIYSFCPTNKAEEVSCKIAQQLSGDDIVINVVDATNLERNLMLTLDLLQKKIPTIIVLNKWDLTKTHGIEIDLNLLSQELSAPVLPVISISGEGINELVKEIKNYQIEKFIPKIYVPENKDEKWKLIGEICSKTQKLFHRHPTLIEKILELTITMPYALIIALASLTILFLSVRLIAETIINKFLDPVFNNLYVKYLIDFVNYLTNNKMIKDFILGKTSDYLQSFGLLTTGIYIPFVVVLPYIFSFYLILSFFEDSGYLVRLAIVFDKFFHKFGLHGYASIPFILGLGCKVPAILSTRILENNREKIIASVLILTMAPCLPQTAMIFSLTKIYGVKPIIFIFTFIIVFGLVSGLVLNKILKGETPELFTEIPKYQLPKIDILLKKIYLRLKTFVLEAVPMIFIGVAMVNLLDLIGAINLISKFFGPVMENILGLPNEVSVVMISGFLRKDVSIALLSPFHLNQKQIIISCITLVIYMPCVATFLVMIKEYKLKIALIIVSSLFIVSLIIGGVLNLIL